MRTIWSGWITSTCDGNRSWRWFASRNLNWTSSDGFCPSAFRAQFNDSFGPVTNHRVGVVHCRRIAGLFNLLGSLETIDALIENVTIRRMRTVGSSWITSISDRSTCRWYFASGSGRWNSRSSGSIWRSAFRTKFHDSFRPVTNHRVRIVHCRRIASLFNLFDSVLPIDTLVKCVAICRMGTVGPSWIASTRFDCRINKDRLLRFTGT